MKYDIQTLKAFHAVAREGSIARAAEKTHLVASAISKRIADLEAGTGTELLYRHRRGVTLTLAGAELLRHAERVLQELASLDGALSNYANGVKGQVRLVANTSAVVQFLPYDLSGFLKNHPTIKIDLEEHTSDEVQRMVTAGEADLGILAPQRPLDGLDGCLYRVDQLMVIMPRGHPLARRKTLRFAQTLAYDYVGLPRGTSLSNVMAKAAADLNQPLKLRIQATSFDGLRRMAAQGLGIGILPKGSVEAFLDTEGLEARVLDEAWAHRDLVLISRPASELPKLTRLLRNHLAGQAQASV
ncbi:LysR family transcriptional regulator [Allopusillimonas soli]|uniref:LysR family transcriptional regulator n=1 Tax=Allopusillimonas soli TaxID=659016 RepID=A0A853FCX4_9BURK|nr:LysR substrate-binding domain-containing protein [Allopusillimonas soli]NYT37502.1 LysR family transcriptional regulator [Allopusillimonas soli]TEA74523.1 LysR family transcriptional regulator [Allopusillimonas soli]